MDEPLTAIELFLLELRTTGTLSREAWDDLRDRLTLPEQPDPAPGVEFAPSEDLPSEVAEDARKRMEAIFDRTAAREAELKKNPPPPSRKAKQSAAAVQNIQSVLLELRRLGCVIEVDLEDEE